MEKRKKRKVLRIPLEDWQRYIVRLGVLSDHMKIERFLYRNMTLEIKDGKKYIRAVGEEYEDWFREMYAQLSEREGLPMPELSNEKEVLLSVLGDSISTYEGYSNDAGANINTARNPVYYSDQISPEDTYWGRLMQVQGLSLCVNNSWSGGLLSGEGNPSSGVERAKYLANDQGEKPDIIILFMGINDLGWGVASEDFRLAYRKTLSVFKELYPNAKVICVNMPDRKPYAERITAEYNKVISDCVLEAGESVYLADLFNYYTKDDESYETNTIDGLHPDKDGMYAIYDVISDVLIDMA